MTQQPWGPQARQNSAGGWPQQGHGQPGRGPQGFGQQQWGGQTQWGAQQQWGGQPQWGGGAQMRPPAAVGQPAGGFGHSPYGQMAPQGQWGPGGFPQAQPRKSSTKLVVISLAGLVALALVFALLQGLGKGGVGGYKNDDYQVPPPNQAPPEIPMVTSTGEAKRMLEGNPLYQQEIPKPVRCEIDENLDLATADPGKIKKHMDDLTACLMRVWDKPLKAAGWTAVRPVSNVYTTKQVSTPCGSAPSRNAFYCGANQQIYYATDLPSVLPPDLAKGRFVIESIIAHEFGHAIQARTKILHARYVAQQQAGSKSEANEINRRLEVQADCFSGAFLGSVAQSTNMNASNLETIKKLLHAIGDDTLSGQKDVDGDHGHGRNRRYWGEMGMASTKMAACNTFTAPSGQVK